MNVTELLRERSKACPEGLAMLDGSGGSRLRALTFSELDAASGRAAARLRDSGLKPGDAVLVMVPMSLELYISLIGILRAGLVAMFLDPSAGKNHIESSCSLNHPKAFIGSPRAHWLRLLSAAIRRIPVKFSTGRVPLRARRLLEPGPGLETDRIELCTPEAPALIRFTSGSTGAPKRSLRTHGFLLEQQRALERSLRLGPGLVDLVTLPIFVLANLASGATSVIPKADLRAPGNVDAGPIIQQLLKTNPHRISAAPAFVARLADFCLSTSMKLDCLQSVYTGGAPVFPHLLDRFHEMAPQAEIVAVYGSTEAEPIAQINREQISESDREAMTNGRGLLAGWPDSAIRIRIQREVEQHHPDSLTALNGEASCQPAGEPGEILVSGRHVNPGERQGARETAWLRTGDAGYLDAKGRLWLLGRCAARIQDEFGTVYPFQVECAALRHPGVQRAALVARRGERVLVVEAKKGLDSAGLKARLDWTHVGRIDVVRRIPMDQRHNGKVDYDALGKLLQKPGVTWKSQSPLLHGRFSKFLKKCA